MTPPSEETIKANGEKGYTYVGNIEDESMPVQIWKTDENGYTTYVADYGWEGGFNLWNTMTPKSALELILKDLNQ